MHVRHLLLSSCLSCLLLLAPSAPADEGNYPANYLIEPPLGSYAKGSADSFQAFRFSLVRSSEDEDLSYTVILKNGNDTPSVTIKTFSKTQNRVTSELSQPLTKGQARNLTRGVLMANFWELPQKTERRGFDGAIWKMEGIESGHKHTTERWSPLPPYYSFVLDSRTDKVVKDPRTPADRDTKSSDEVGLDVFSLMVIYLKPAFDEELY